MVINMKSLNERLREYVFLSMELENYPATIAAEKEIGDTDYKDERKLFLEWAEEIENNNLTDINGVPIRVGDTVCNIEDNYSRGIVALIDKIGDGRYLVKCADEYGNTIFNKFPKNLIHESELREDSIMETITVNGKEYIEKTKDYEPSEHICVIADRGWIFEGYHVPNEENCKLTNANVVRRWDNGRGIGGLVNPDYKDEYTLDYIGDIEILYRAVIAIIPLRW